MTNEEAIKWLKAVKDIICVGTDCPYDKDCNGQCSKAISLAITVLDKQIPKMRLGGNRCPVCDAFADGDYCWRCGQRLGVRSTVNEKN